MKKVLAVLGVLAVGVPGVHAQTPGLVGSWVLASVQKIDADGKATTQPLPRGILVFERGGHVFELAETGRRVPYAANQPTPAEAFRVYGNYSGFWGGYAVDAAKSRITYHPEGAISPNAMGADLVRTFELTGDRLVETASAGEADGQSGLRWTWDRVPTLETLGPSNRALLGFWQHVLERRVNLTTGAVISQTERAPSIIVYSASGFVGVHFVPKGRTPFAAVQPTEAEAASAMRGIVSYYGAYTLTPGTVFHHRQIIFGTAPGDTLRRFYTMTGDRLMLKFPPVRNQQGDEVQMEVNLRRVTKAADMIP